MAKVDEARVRVRRTEHGFTIERAKGRYRPSLLVMKDPDDLFYVGFNWGKEWGSRGASVTLFGIHFSVSVGDWQGVDGVYYRG